MAPRIVPVDKPADESSKTVSSEEINFYCELTQEIKPKGQK